MSAKPVLTKVQHLRSGGSSMVYLHPFLKNDGSDTLETGDIICKQRSKDGTVSTVKIYNDTPLEPGETTKLIVELYNHPKELRITAYEDCDGNTYPMQYVARKRLLGGWSL